MVKKIYTFLILLTTLSATQLFAQTDSYTIWIGQTEIFAHHETDVGDTVEIKRSMFNGTDELVAEYHHDGTPAHGSSTRLTIKDDMSHLIRGEANIQNQAAHKASISTGVIVKNWKLTDVKYVSVSLVVHNDGEASAHGYKVGVLKLVD
jgi:hypothetical protein